MEPGSGLRNRFNTQSYNEVGPKERLEFYTFLFIGFNYCNGCDNVFISVFRIIFFIQKRLERLVIECDSSNFKRSVKNSVIDLCDAVATMFVDIRFKMRIRCWAEIEHLPTYLKNGVTAIVKL